VSSSDSPRDEGSKPSGGILSTVVPNFIRHNFALKFALVLGLMALSVGAIGLTATGAIQDYTQEQVSEEYTTLAAQESGTVDQWVERNKLSTNFVAEKSGWTGDDESSLKASLQTQRSDLSADVANIHLVEQGNPHMEVVASTSLDSGANLSAAGRSWTTTIQDKNQVTVSDVYQTDQGPVVGYTRLVKNGITRFILIEYETSGLADSLQGADRNEGGFTQVVGKSGTIMIDESRAGSSEDRTLTTYTTSQTNRRPVEAATSLRGSDRTAGVNASMPANADVIGEQYAVGYAPVDGTDWVVLVHAPASSVFGFVDQVRLWGLIGTALMIVLIGGVGAALGYNTASAIDRLTRKAEEMREGNLDVEIESARIDNIGQLYDGFSAMRDSLKNQIDEAERARKEAEVSRAEAMEMNTYLEEKAEEFSEAMAATAAGDMTQRMTTDGENDAMDRIAEEFNAMIAELEKTTGQLTSFADEVAESGDIVLTSAESVRDAAEQVAESIQKISDDAYAQQERLQSVSNDLDDLVTSLEEVEAKNPSVDMDEPLEQCRAVATAIQAAVETSEQMMPESENVAGASEEQAAELNEVSERAEKLKRYASPLGDILNRFETEAEHEFVFSGGPSQTTDQSED